MQALTEEFPGADGMCPFIGMVEQCLPSQVGQQTCSYSRGQATDGSSACAMVPGSKQLVSALSRSF